MADPVLLAVDDDRGVLRAVEADLRARYGDGYRILGATSGEEALDVLRRLRLRDDPVALLLVDQRMPGMNGVELLERSRGLYPEAKRALLTAYADTEAAIKAINAADVDYYLLKPWHPPEERLYPILDDLLETWRPPQPTADLRVIGHRWSRPSHDLRDFLARNLVPYHWMDVELDPQAQELLDLAGVDGGRLPVVVLGDGTALAEPTPEELGHRVGLQIHAERTAYDLVIVGAGPAGLAAGVYGASEGLSTLIVEQVAPGGQAGMSSRIENYLGFPRGLSGSDLTARARQQALRLGAEILTPVAAVGVVRKDPYRLVRLSDGSEVSTAALLIATGVTYRRLDLPGGEALTGAGIYYGSGRQEALAHKGEDVYILGGGNSAGQAAMFLSEFAASVTILVRSDSLAESMSRYLIEQLEATDTIRVRFRTRVVGAAGDGRLEALTIADDAAGTNETVTAGALFIFIGMAPHTDWVADVVERDRYGFIYSGADLGPHPHGWSLERLPLLLETSAPGVFVAGDVRFGSIKRVASAVGEGAMAVRFVHEHLASL